MEREGQTLGHYRLIGMIGRGGFANVYLGEHIYLKTQVAVKLLHTQIAPDMMEHFLAEAQTVARLVHPHIVRVHDFGIDDSTPFLVMDYAPNGTLRQRHIRGLAVPLNLVIAYTRQIASALQYAHEQRLIHRDIKPENMLLGSNSEVLLSDFGIATIAHTSRSLPTQDISGTIAYMAPEQIQGKSRPASDQYSLAVIVYEWLTGRCPFQGSFAEVASQHLFSPPTPPRMLYASIPATVEQVLLVALAKNPDARFARVEAFARALEQASQSDATVLPLPVRPDAAPLADAAPTELSTHSPTILVSPTLSGAAADGGPTALAGAAAYTPHPVTPLPASNAPIETPPTPLEGLRIAARREDQPGQGVSRRLVIGGLAALVVAAGAGAAGFALTRTQAPAANTPNATPTTPPTSVVTARPTAQPTSAPTQNPTVPGGNTAPVIFRGTYEQFSVSWSTDGRLVSAGNGALIQVWNPANGNLLFSFDSGTNTVYSVAWSPNGRYIASGHADGTLRIWDGTSGTSLKVISAHANQVNEVAWSPDSTRVVSAGGDKLARVWDIASGSNLVNYTGHVHYVNTVAWSHNGRYIVSGSGNHTDNHNAQVWDAASGQTLYTYNGHTDEVLALAWSPDDSRIASASDDTTVQVWDSSNGTLFLRYSGHSSYVVALGWSPDGNWISSGGGDHTQPGSDTSVQVWNARTGNQLYSYRGHRSEVEGLAWSPDSRRIASASDDQTVQVWELPNA